MHETITRPIDDFELSIERDRNRPATFVAIGSFTVTLLIHNTGYDIEEFQYDDGSLVSADDFGGEIVRQLTEHVKTDYYFRLKTDAAIEDLRRDIHDSRMATAADARAA